MCAPLNLSPPPPPYPYERIADYAGHPYLEPSMPAPLSWAVRHPHQNAAMMSCIAIAVLVVLAYVMH